MSDVSAPTTGVAGSNLVVDVVVNNTGSLLAPASTLSAWLSVDGALSVDWDLPLGNTSVPSIDANQSDTVQFSGTIPANAQGGNYSVIVMVDSDELIDERNELDNEGMAEDELLVDQKATACPAQDDGGSGGDAGGDENTAYLLGEDISMTITGCVDEDVDTEDWYEVVVSPGLNLTVTLVNSPDQDADVYLRDSAGEWFERGYLAGSNDETISTADDAT